MIVSVSRRTDIPAFYSDWFYNRLTDGYVDVINPFNAKQANRISLKKEDVECFVFWTKNPKRFMERLNELDGYNYYFQFTLNSYGKDIEPNVPCKSDELIEIFIKLSKKIGKEKLIWRYDPIILTDKYTIGYHIKYFEKLVERLHEYTEKCVISFLDLYKKSERNLRGINLTELTEDVMDTISREFSNICKKYGLVLATCCEAIDLEKYDIKHNKCIDDELIENITGNKVLNNKRDKQRTHCGCIKCSDIGAYNTCMHGCLYCYASYNQRVIESNYKKHNVNSSILIGEISKDIKIY